MNDTDYALAVRRSVRVMLLLALGGVIGFVVTGHRDKAISFVAGAAVAGLSFWRLYRMVADIGKAMQGGRIPATSMLLHAVRLLILGGAVFAILKVYGGSTSAMAAGLCVPVAAITLEAIYESIYA